MASATSFYDFKPLDSQFTDFTSHFKAFAGLFANTKPFYREGAAIRARQSQREDGPSRKHRFKMVHYSRTVRCLNIYLLILCLSGFTPQFEGLEKLYKNIISKHPNQFLILGFPCNQFGNQDPGTDDTIQEFCQVNYGVSFPIMKKTDVNGDKAEPVYEWMKKEMPGLMGMKRIKWNFEKFLIGPDGQVKGRWASTTKPEALEGPILAELGSEGKKAKDKEL